MHQNRRLYMNVTINDIARATGLSTATISKYINHKKIREENRILIEKAIQELGYTPNRNAQLLRAKNTHTIGILISDLGNYFWGLSIPLSSISQIMAIQLLSVLSFLNIRRRSIRYRILSPSTLTELSCSHPAGMMTCTSFYRMLAYRLYCSIRFLLP